MTSDFFRDNIEKGEMSSYFSCFNIEKGRMTSQISFFNIVMAWFLSVSARKRSTFGGFSIRFSFLQPYKNRFTNRFLPLEDYKNRFENIFFSLENYKRRFANRFLPLENYKNRFANRFFPLENYKRRFANRFLPLEDYNNRYENKFLSLEDYNGVLFVIFREKNVNFGFPNNALKGDELPVWMLPALMRAGLSQVCNIISAGAPVWDMLDFPPATALFDHIENGQTPGIFPPKYNGFGQEY